jgi:hypothetical protein
VFDIFPFPNRERQKGLKATNYFSKAEAALESQPAKQNDILGKVS